MHALRSWLLVGFAVALLGACSERGPFEKAGEAADDAAGDVSDAVDDAADDLGDAVDEATEDLDDHD